MARARHLRAHPHTHGVRSARGRSNVALVAIDSTPRTRQIERRASQQGRAVIERTDSTRSDALLAITVSLICVARACESPVRRGTAAGIAADAAPPRETVRRLTAHAARSAGQAHRPLRNFYLVITKSYCIFMMLNLASGKIAPRMQQVSAWQARSA